MDVIHVMPINDLREQADSPECWCKPIHDEEEPNLYIHNSMDERELYEQGKRRLS